MKKVFFEQKMVLQHNLFLLILYQYQLHRMNIIKWKLKKKSVDNDVPGCRDIDSILCVCEGEKLLVFYSQCCTNWVKTDNYYQNGVCKKCSRDKY